MVGGVGGGLAWADPNLRKSCGQIPTSLAPPGARNFLTFKEHSAVGKVHSWSKTWTRNQKKIRLAAEYFLTASRFALEVTISFFSRRGCYFVEMAAVP